jgi:hypothetical protein
VQTTRHPDGTQTHVDTRTRTTFHTDHQGRVASLEQPGLRASGFRPDGRAAHIEHSRPDGSHMIVQHGMRGDRRVEIVRPDHVRVVTYGRQGFVERPFRQGFVSRTYVVGGRTEVSVYRTHTYGRIQYVTYVPRVYYQPAFYGWAVRPWDRRVAFAWGWTPSTPWFYRGYFAPEPVYATPALWLTDFLLAMNLRQAYDNQQAQYQDAQQPPPYDVSQNSGAPLTPEIKMQIAEEVRRQLLETSAQASTGQYTTSAPPPESADAAPPPALKQRVFVVSTSLDVTALGGGQTCSLTAGDIIERTPGQPVSADGMALVNVMSSKPGDCPPDFATQIDVATLQDMQNQFRQQISNGMESLASNEGRTLPNGPAANSWNSADGQPPIDTAGDAQARDMLTRAGQEADQTIADTQRAISGR